MHPYNYTVHGWGERPYQPLPPQDAPGGENKTWLSSSLRVSFTQTHSCFTFSSTPTTTIGNRHKRAQSFRSGAAHGVNLKGAKMF